MSASSSLRRAATTGTLLVLAAAAVSGCGTADGIAADEFAPTVLAGRFSARPTWSSSRSPARAERSDKGDVLITDGATGFGSDGCTGRLRHHEELHGRRLGLHAADADPFATALSQVGEVAAGFFLGTAEGVPAFSMKDADTNDEGHTTRAMAEEPLDPDEWVHLAGVFDADKGEISLFIDGKQAAVTPFSAPFQPARVADGRHARSRTPRHPTSGQGRSPRCASSRPSHRQMRSRS